MGLGLGLRGVRGVRGVKKSGFLHQVEVLVVRLGQPHLDVRLALGPERGAVRHEALVRLLAVAGVRVELQIVRAHVVHARDGVASAAAEAVEVGVALHVEALTLDRLALLVERRHKVARGRLAVGLAARNGCQQGTGKSVATG